MLDSSSPSSLEHPEHFQTQSDQEFIIKFLSKMDNDLDSFGKIMLKTNQEFYRSENCTIEDKAGCDFSTLASRDSSRKNLAEMTYFFAYQAWLNNGKKENFQYAEIGAGNGDLSLEMINIREALKTSENEDLKAFSHSLKFNICDFENMHQMQREKLAEKSEEFVFHSLDLSINQIPKFDFIFGNEIPDTQRVDFIMIRDGVGYFIGAEKSDNKIKTEKQIDAEELNKLKEIFNLSGEDGLYPIQTGNILFFHNLNNATDNYFMSDYYCDDVTIENYLRIYSKNIPKPINLIQTYESNTIEYLKICKEFSNFFDITYSPQISKKFLQDFSSLFFYFGEDETDQGVVKLSNDGRSITPSEFIEICSISNIPKELQNYRYLESIKMNKSGDDNIKNLPLAFKKKLHMFRDRFLNNVKTLKILLEKKIIDADDYDGGSTIIFKLLDENKIDQAKLLIEHSKELLILAKENHKTLLEYSKEKFPDSHDLHKLIEEKFERIKADKPRSSISEPSGGVSGATPFRQ